jgi:hypothetical protein
MPLPTSINDLSTTAASNFPDGGQSPTVLDDVQRLHASYIAALRDVVLSGTANLSTLNLSYAGTLTGGTGVVNLGSGQLYKDAAGKVGVGTSTPVTRVHITGAGGTSSGSLSLSPVSTGGGASYLVMGNSDSVGAPGPSLIAAANRIIQFGVGNSFAAADGGVLTEFARIDASGNFLLGTTGALNFSAALRIKTSANQYPAEFYATGTQSFISIANDSSANLIGSQAGALTFFSNSGGGQQQRFQVKVSGQIGLTPMSAPGSPTEGDIYYDTSARKHYGYNGTAWQAFY